MTPGPTRPQITAAGTWRVYWNRHGAAPNVWCIAPEEVSTDGARWEIAVASFTLEQCSVLSVHSPKATPDDEDGRPSGWIEVTGDLYITADGHALIAGRR